MAFGLRAWLGLQSCSGLVINFGVRFCLLGGGMWLVVCNFGRLVTCLCFSDSDFLCFVDGLSFVACGWRLPYGTNALSVYISIVLLVAKIAKQGYNHVSIIM